MIEAASSGDASLVQAAGSPSSRYETPKLTSSAMNPLASPFMYYYYPYGSVPNQQGPVPVAPTPQYSSGQQVMLMPYSMPFGYYGQGMGPQHYQDGYGNRGNGYRGGNYKGKRDNGGQFNVDMTADELYISLKQHFQLEVPPRVSWLNRMLTKCNTMDDFEKAAELLKLYKQQSLRTTPETGTLFIKAACRAGAQERALKLLNDDEYKPTPTLGGMHYLMISFSLHQQTSSVLQTFETIKRLMLKPNPRTYHILIRECVDKGLIERALEYADECRRGGLVPNRVTYNILMNGCRKLNLPDRMLQFRQEMAQFGIEINDSTCKFVAIAHMMLGDLEAAVKAFLEYPEKEVKMEEYCKKVLEVASEGQKDLVVELFTALKERGVQLPSNIDTLLADLDNNPIPSRPGTPLDSGDDEFKWLLELIDDPEERKVHRNGKPSELMELMQQWHLQHGDI